MCVSNGYKYELTINLKEKKFCVCVNNGYRYELTINLKEGNENMWSIRRLLDYADTDQCSRYGC